MRDLRTPSFLLCSEEEEKEEEAKEEEAEGKEWS